MPQNLLEQLRKYTVVVADTGDIEAMEKFRPQDATTNPSLITAAAQMPQYEPIVDGVLKDARNELRNRYFLPSGAVRHTALTLELTVGCAPDVTASKNLSRDVTT